MWSFTTQFLLCVQTGIALKMVLESDVLEWIVQQEGFDDPEDVLDMYDTSEIEGTDKQLKDVASRSYAYHTSSTASSYQSTYGGQGLDQAGRTQKEVVNGSCTGCSSGAGSGLIYEYSYLAGNHATQFDQNEILNNPGGATDINIVFWIVVEDIKKPNNDLIRRNIYGRSREGKPLRHGV